MNLQPARSIALCALLSTLAAAPNAPSFAGITLGETAHQLIEQRGDPLEVFDRPNDLEYVYLAPAGNALVFASLERGRVTAVEGVTMPPRSLQEPRLGALGIHLHDDASALAKLPAAAPASSSERGKAEGKGPFRGPDGLDYYFSAQLTVTGITARLPAPLRTALPQEDSKPVIHLGRTASDAIVIKADSENAGVASEYEYLAYHGCSRYDGAATTQTLLTAGGREFDKLTATGCHAGADGDYYFDITNYFGKM